MQPNEFFFYENLYFLNHTGIYIIFIKKVKENDLDLIVTCYYPKSITGSSF